MSIAQWKSFTLTFTVECISISFKIAESLIYLSIRTIVCKFRYTLSCSIFKKKNQRLYQIHFISFTLYKTPQNQKFEVHLQFTLILIAKIDFVLTVLFVRSIHSEEKQLIVIKLKKNGQKMNVDFQWFRYFFEFKSMFVDWFTFIDEKLSVQNT